MDVIYCSGEDRGYKRCKCSSCGCIEICTPEFDFYTTPDHGDRLICEQCFQTYIMEGLEDKKGPERTSH